MTSNVVEMTVMIHKLTNQSVSRHNEAIQHSLLLYCNSYMYIEANKYAYRVSLHTSL